MTIIAELPFTQYDNLNILGQFRINGVLVNPGGGQDIRILSGNQTQQIDDDILIITGPGILSLIDVTTGIKQITIKSKLTGGGDITITPDGTNTVNETTTLVLGPGTSTVLAPIASGTDWEIIG